MTIVSQVLREICAEQAKTLVKGWATLPDDDGLNSLLDLVTTEWDALMTAHRGPYWDGDPPDVDAPGLNLPY